MQNLIEQHFKNKKPHYVIPDGVAISYWEGNNRIVRMPGVYPCEADVSNNIMIIGPHIETGASKCPIQFQDCNYKHQVLVRRCIVQEIVDHLKYCNCDKPVFSPFKGESGEMTNSIDGEIYVEYVFDHIIKCTLENMTLDEASNMINRELEIVENDLMRKKRRLLQDDAGVIIHRAYILISHIERKDQ